MSRVTHWVSRLSRRGLRHLGVLPLSFDEAKMDMFQFR